MGKRYVGMTISVDFDGVIHSYTTPNRPFDPTLIPDPPVRRAIDWLSMMVADPDFKIVIFSTRNHQDGGIDAMRAWLLENGLPPGVLDQIEFPITKPPAHLSIDDRAFRFEGIFPGRREIRDFKPWNKP